MPANLKDLKNRIKSVKSTQQITKAMKLVSTAKLGRAQSNVVQARPYSQGISQMSSRLLASLGEAAGHPLLAPRSSNVVLLVVLSSERGLCGGYNANIGKMALKTIEEQEAAGKVVNVVCIGKKAMQVVSRKWGKGVSIATHNLSEVVADPNCMIKAVNNGEKGLVQLFGSFDKPSYDISSKLAQSFASLYSSNAIAQLSFIVSRFQSALVQVPTVEMLLPIAENSSGSVKDPLGSDETIFEPSVSELVDAVMPRYLATRVYQALLESVASEHGSRMTAMDNATRNAKDLERKLQITYQRARQAAITTELVEIISGAEAL